MSPRSATDDVCLDCSCPDETLTLEKGQQSSPLRSVSFSTHIDVQEVPHWKDLPEEEVVATWYTNEEFLVIKNTLIATIRLMMSKKPIPDDMCTRGLEFRHPEGARMRKKNKIDALTAVWNEQVAQWKEDKTDVEAISLVYQRQSYRCQSIARRFGLSDEQEATAYLYGYETPYRQVTLSQETSQDRKQNIRSDVQKLVRQPRRSSLGPAAA